MRLASIALIAAGVVVSAAIFATGALVGSVVTGFVSCQMEVGPTVVAAGAYPTFEATHVCEGSVCEYSGPAPGYPSATYSVPTYSAPIASAPIQGAEADKPCYVPVPTTQFVVVPTTCDLACCDDLALPACNARIDANHTRCARAGAMPAAQRAALREVSRALEEVAHELDGAVLYGPADAVRRQADELRPRPSPEQEPREFSYFGEFAR